MSIRNQASRWHRPTLYVTIVAIYLFVVGVAVGLAHIYINSNFQINSDYVAVFKIGDLFLMYVFAAGAIGSAIMLLLRWELGVYFALGGLTLLAIRFVLTSFTFDWAMTNTPMYATTILIVLTVAMYPLLILGWKRDQWIP